VDDDARSAWTQPGTYEIAPGTGVYRVPLPLPNDGLRAVNVYAIADGDQVVLVDSGWALAESEALLAKSLAEIGYGLGDIREFLVTHVHRDHYTQAIAIRRLHGTPVALGEGERPAIKAIERAIDAGTPHPIDHLHRAGADVLMAQLRKSRGEVSARQDWGPPDRWLTNGVALALRTRTLRVIATPGHTRGHVVFHDAMGGTMFAGDHVLPHITPSIGFEAPPAKSPLRDYLESLRLMLSLPDARLLPAHGPVAPSVHARVEQLLDHHEARLTATAKAVEQGAATGYEVARVLRWTRRERAFDDLDLLNQMLAVQETVAHLDVLVERSWLAVETTPDGVARYWVG
jgi:glyoxylase-like metal-dependent hydrolase (beta-lactamase superfamily II)